MTLVIATIIMLPGFMVGVSAINRSLTKSSNDLFFDEDNRVDDIDLGEVSDDGIIPFSYFDYEVYKDRFVQSNKDNDINIETINPRTNSTPEMSTYLKMYKYNNDTSYGNVDLVTGDLNTSFNLAKLVGNNGMDLELSIRYSSDDSKNGEAVWTNLTGETIYYALYKSEVYKLEVLI